MGNWSLLSKFRETDSRVRSGKSLTRPPYHRSRCDRTQAQLRNGVSHTRCQQFAEHFLHARLNLVRQRKEAFKISNLIQRRREGFKMIVLEKGDFCNRTSAFQARSDANCLKTSIVCNRFAGNALKR